MLTATIDALKRFFMEQNMKPMFMSHFFHEPHEKHIMVDSQVTFFENRSQLKLARSNLVVASLARNTQFKRADFQFFHKGLNSLWDCTKIMVVHLLVFSRIMSHQRSTCKNQVRTSRIQGRINEKIFLFPS